MRALLVVVGGLPGTGKSTLSGALARALGAPVFTKDQIEASLWRDGVKAEQNSWHVAENLLTTLAAEQLTRGQSAILDTVARVAESRAMWRMVAESHGAAFRLIECVCSDLTVHRSRIEGRIRDIPGWYEVTWDEVEGIRSRSEPWAEDHLVLDAVRPSAENFATALRFLDLDGRVPPSTLR
jgi:predicted kinase